MPNNEKLKQDILVFQHKYEKEIANTELETLMQLSLTAATSHDDGELNEILKMRIEQEKSDLKVIALEKLEKKGYDLFAEIILQLGMTL